MSLTDKRSGVRCWNMPTCFYYYSLFEQSQTCSDLKTELSCHWSCHYAEKQRFRIVGSKHKIDKLFWSHWKHLQLGKKFKVKGRLHIFCIFLESLLYKTNVTKVYETKWSLKQVSTCCVLLFVVLSWCHLEIWLQLSTEPWTIILNSTFTRFSQHVFVPPNVYNPSSRSAKRISKTLQY